MPSNPSPIRYPDLLPYSLRCTAKVHCETSIAWFPAPHHSCRKMCPPFDGDSYQKLHNHPCTTLLDATMPFENRLIFGMSILQLARTWIQCKGISLTARCYYSGCANSDILFQLRQISKPDALFFLNGNCYEPFFYTPLKPHEPFENFGGIQHHSGKTAVPLG